MRSIRHLTPLLALAALAAPAAGAVGGDELCKSAEVADLFEKMLRHEAPSLENEPCTAPECAQGCSEKCVAMTAKYRSLVALDPMVYYAYKIGQKREIWDAILPLITERYSATDACPSTRGTLVDLVSRVPYADASTVAASLWKHDTKAFTLDHVLLFAFSGAEPFTSEVAGLARKANTESSADVRPAVFLALQGKDVGKEALARTVAQADFSAGSASMPLFAALGLEKLGKAGTLEEVRGRVREAALSALDDGDLCRARALALQAEHFDKARSYPLKSLVHLDENVAWHCEARSKEVACEGSVFQLLESVIPL